MRRTAGRVARLERELGARTCPGCLRDTRVFLINEGDPRPVPKPCAVCGKPFTGHYRVIILAKS